MEKITALYLRLSKEDGDKDESNSIASQRALLEDYVTNHPELTPCEEYVDDGFTGTNFNRPSMENLLSDIRAEKIKAVIVKDLSRLGRDYKGSGIVLEDVFPAYHVRFIAVNDGIDRTDDEFNMMLPIKNIFNESYSRDISKKVQSSFKVMQNSGAFCGAYCSFGYCKNPDNKHKLIIDPYAATIVQRIYELYLSGKGQKTIASILNTEHIPCPSVYKRENGEKYHNGNRLEKTEYWTYSTIHRILQNEMYTGVMVQNKTVRAMRGKARTRPESEWIKVPDTHPAIIEREKWERVQVLLRAKTREINFENEVSIFAGILKCADCKRAMAKHKFNGGRKITYTCGSYTRSGSQFCSNHAIEHSVLEKIVLDDIRKIVDSIKEIKSIVESTFYATKGVDDFGKKELQITKQKLEKNQRNIKKLYFDLRDELITKEEYYSIRQDYLSQQDYLKQRIATLEATEEKTNIIYDEWVENLLSHDMRSLDRSTVVMFIERIEIGQRDETGNQNVNIVYRFKEDLDLLFQAVYES